MQIDEIRQLAELLAHNQLSVLEIEQDGLRIHMERSFSSAATQPAAAPVSVISTLPQMEETRVDFNQAQTVDAPMVGVFYAAPAPGQAAFVQVGSQVKQGDVLCIIESMKLMNEITAPMDGQIADVCVGDGDVVEFGQTLFKIC